MARKKLLINCSEDAKQQLCAAIRMYAEAAYPPGGSECAQVARETLMDAANSIEQQYAEHAQAEISGRLRSQLKLATEFFAEMAESEGQDIENLVTEFQSIIKGKNTG